MRTTASILATSLTATLAAQNLVINGDFESGNANGWTFSGFSVQPKVMRFNTNGTGVSQSFSNRPGSKPKTSPPGGSYTKQQPVMMVKGVQHLLVADIAVANTLPLVNVDAGDFTFYADGVRINRVKLKSILQKEIKRRQVCIRFTPQATGQKPLRIVFSRAWGANLGTPRHHIDNIVLLRLPRLPLVCPRGERKVGGSLTLDMYGTAGRRFAMFLALTRLPKPVTIPGFQGNWSLPLPPQSVPVLFANFDKAGSFRLQAALSASTAGVLAGVPLHWQGVEDVANAAPSLGTVNSFGIYK